MLRRLLVMVAWCALAYIAYVTLSPVELRPETSPRSGVFDRFVAYGLLGALFVAAYPRDFVRVMTFVIAVAVSLELLQNLTPDRHARALDFVEKVLGALAGGSLANLLQMLRTKFSQRWEIH